MAALCKEPGNWNTVSEIKYKTRCGGGEFGRPGDEKCGCTTKGALDQHPEGEAPDRHPEGGAPDREGEAPDRHPEGRIGIQAPEQHPEAHRS